MAQYINKTDLVTELERRRDLHFKVYLENGFESSESKYDENKYILSFIDGLKVLEIKKVNLEEEIVRVSKNEYFDFTGKCKNFDDWFASFADYEKYVHDHNNIFKLFDEDGSHCEVPVGSWIVKTPDGYNVAYVRAAYRQNSAWSEKYIADVFEKTGLAKIAREQANDRLTRALQDVLLELSKSTPTPDDWVEDYWQHHKVNNPLSYDGGDEIQFDHYGFLRFCQTYFHK